MTFHHLRAPRSAAAPPAACQPGPVTLALRAMQAEMTKPRPIGPVTAAIRTMRAADPAFDQSPDLLALRRALADRIEADIAALDMLGGDPDLEPSLCGASTCHLGGSLTPSTPEGDDREDDAGDNPEEENEHGTHEDHGEELLGWCENVGQLALGQNTADGDATAIETRGGGFYRSGHDDDEDSHDAEGNTDDNGIADAHGESEQALRHIAAGGTLNHAWRRNA